MNLRKILNRNKLENDPQGQENEVDLNVTALLKRVSGKTNVVLVVTNQVVNFDKSTKCHDYRKSRMTYQTRFRVQENTEIYLPYMQLEWLRQE